MCIPSGIIIEHRHGTLAFRQQNVVTASRDLARYAEPTTTRLFLLRGLQKTAQNLVRPNAIVYATMSMLHHQELNSGVVDLSVPVPPDHPATATSASPACDIAHQSPPVQELALLLLRLNLLDGFLQVELRCRESGMRRGSTGYTHCVDLLGH